MAKRLTDIGIRNLKPAPVRREIPDGGCTGLYLISQPSGARSWAVRYRFNGKPTKLTIGSWPAVSLLDARAAAIAALKQLGKGKNPAAAKQAAKVEAMEAQANTVASICAAYLKREGGKLRTSDQRARIFHRLVYPAIGERPIDSIKRSDLVRMLDQIEDKSGARMADVTLAVLRRVFTWHALRTDDFASPIVRGMGSRHPVAEHRRSRSLDDDELRKLWTATADNTPFSALVRLALLTSARRNEIAGMRWDEVDANGVWMLPAARSKTKVEVVRPLSKAAQSVLAELPQIDGCPFAVTSNGVTPIASFSEPKRKLDAASGVTGWRIHDTRRTARSLLSRAGVNADIAERCLGHALPGIRATYDRHRYLDEMRHAFEALATEIERVVNPPEGAVIPLRRR
jgi:integrase